MFLCFSLDVYIDPSSAIGLVWDPECVFFGCLCKKKIKAFTVLPAKNGSEIMFGLQSYQGLIIDRSLVY